MDYSNQDIKKQNRVKIIMLAALGLLTMKYIFVDFGIDAEFQIIMSYRLAMGDTLFSQMWEPCQTSAFLGAFFIKLYMWLFHTTTGLVLYMQIIGVLLDLGVASLLFQTVKKHLNTPNTAFLWHGSTCLFPQRIFQPQIMRICRYGFQHWLVLCYFCILKLRKRDLL